MKIVAIKAFRNKETRDMFYPGDVITSLPDDRAEHAIEKGLALRVADGEKSGEAKVDARSSENGSGGGKPDTGHSEREPVTDIDMTQQWQKIVAAVKTFEDAEMLKGYLAAENALEKPRVSVVLALDNRIKELSETNKE